jgi:hypothetical protein
MQQLTANLAQYRAIAMWKPQLGDIVIQHGFLTHWFGVVSGVDRSSGYGSLTITKAGMPVLLVTMHDAESEKNKVSIPIADILTSKGGKFAALQLVTNSLIWYV